MTTTAELNFVVQNICIITSDNQVIQYKPPQCTYNYLSEDDYSIVGHMVKAVVTEDDDKLNFLNINLVRIDNMHTSTLRLEYNVQIDVTAETLFKVGLFTSLSCQAPILANAELLLR